MDGITKRISKLVILSKDSPALTDTPAPDTGKDV